MKVLRWSMWFVAGAAGLLAVGCITEASDSLFGADGLQTARSLQMGSSGSSGGGHSSGHYGNQNANDNGGSNGNDNGDGNGNDNGAGNGNDNGAGNGNDNGAGNGNDNGAGNGNDNGAGNGNDNGAGNGNDNGAGNGNDNGGNGNDNGNCPDGMTRVKTELHGIGDGDMEYRDFGSCKRFRARVDDSLPFKTLTVYINDVAVGTIHTDSRGRGELRYDTEDGNFPPDFPNVIPGDVGDVGHILMGVFINDCSANDNCNG